MPKKKKVGVGNDGPVYTEGRRIFSDTKASVAERDPKLLKLQVKCWISKRSPKSKACRIYRKAKGRK